MRMENKVQNELDSNLMTGSDNNNSTELLTEQIEKLRKDNEMLNLNVEELSKTNEYLVTATWREREMKQQLHAALEELKETKKLVDKQHKSIKDSINYASRIQDAIIPNVTGSNALRIMAGSLSD